MLGASRGEGSKEEGAKRELQTRCKQEGLQKGNLQTRNFFRVLGPLAGRGPKGRSGKKKTPGTHLLQSAGGLPRGGVQKEGAAQRNPREILMGAHMGRPSADAINAGHGLHVMYTEVSQVGGAWDLKNT